MGSIDGMNGPGGASFLPGLDGLGGTKSGRTNTSESESLLLPPSASVGGSTLLQAMLMVEENLFNQQKSADARRDAADKAEMAAAKKAVESMREEAKDTFRQALVSGALQMMSAAAKIASVSDAIKAGVGENGQLNPGAAADWSKVNGVVGEIWGKAADGAKLGFDSVIKSDQEEKAQHDLDAKAANQRSQVNADFSRDVHDLATRTLQKLDEILQARNQTALAIMRA